VNQSGIMAFLSWGLFSPLAVEVSLLRSLLPKGSAWFQLHRGFNALGYSLTVSAFAVAVAFTKKEGYSPHFTFPHQKMGLAIFIIASVQMLAGILRPHATPGEEKKPVRSAWEWGHRILGIALLACGFYQMQSGILLYLLKYSVGTDTQNKLAIAYWVWIGLMTAIIVIGLVKRSVTKEDSGAGATDAGAEDHGAPSAEGTASQQVLGQPSGSA
jgi:Na+/melibiose symporter-like transporter